MTAARVRTSVVDLSPEDLRGRLDDALSVYVTAMGYPPGTARQRSPMWTEHSHRSGWRAVGAVDDRGALRGIAYGYPGAPGQWWFEEVRRGLSSLRRTQFDHVVHGIVDADRAAAFIADYFELTELHVDPRAQGHGIGEALARRLLGRADAGHVLLSTPEARGRSRAWSLYRSLGFEDVLRHHRFSSDPRPFAVLGRPLPLPPRPDTA